MKNLPTRRAPSGRGRQAGITLVIGLIMLVLLTLMAVTAFHLGTSQTSIVANAQHRSEALNAAQQAIDTVINTGNFMINPDAALSGSSCGTSSTNTLCVDVNGDSKPDVTVSLSPKPKCLSGAPIPNDSLDFTKTDDLACSNGQPQCFGVPGCVSSNSLCSNSNWEVTAVASDTATNANVTVVQGISSRIATTDLSNNCN
jgi:Tfp pilus assembly protein PilX